MRRPLVSALMLTYGRYMGEDADHTIFLDEAVECFLRQDYQRKELIILNDTPGQPVVFDHPQVRVINWAERYPTLGEKRNAAAAFAQGDLLMVWDDDDISFPWRMTQAALHFKAEKPDYAGAHGHFFSERNVDYQYIESAPGYGGLFASAAYTREAIFAVPYVAMDCGEDQRLVRDMQAAGRKIDQVPCDIRNCPIIYRWNYLARHISALPVESGYATLGETHYPEKTIQIQPRWSYDYLEHTRRLIVK